MRQRTYAELQHEIEALQKQAEDVREKEIALVIGRIKEAVSFYGLVPADLFSAPSGASATSKRAKGASSASEPSPISQKANRTARAKAKPKAPPKFKDPSSEKTWNGVGKRPNWYVSAIEAGTDVAELIISPAESMA
ncbi:H-NS family nucleoid-associated regulatory protein [Pseudorhodoferax sp. Leaf265]|uniref:H-NS histone family protein n=1 Tax=Pseudorhodoferax sp. Leaf265 TaxID=1736315 RepID=UPI001F27F220|nr:H-NS histone family protein [Pseudorhodoferax sp. Leaf265]